MTPKSALMVVPILSILAVNGHDSYHCRYIRRAEKSGFHRDVETNVSVEFPMRPFSSSCDIVLEETLPSSMYADLHQLHMLHDMGGHMVFSSEKIDVEKPEHLSKEHTVYVYGHLQREAMDESKDGFQALQGHVSIPLHLRYHKPLPGTQQFNTANLPPPNIYIRCDDMDLSFFDPKIKELPCPASPQVSCNWTPLKCSLSGSGDLKFKVPTGSKQHLPLVAVITIIVIIGGTFLLSAFMIKNQPITHVHSD